MGKKQKSVSDGDVKKETAKCSELENETTTDVTVPATQPTSQEKDTRHKKKKHSANRSSFVMEKTFADYLRKSANDNVTVKKFSLLGENSDENFIITPETKVSADDIVFSTTKNERKLELETEEKLIDLSTTVADSREESGSFFFLPNDPRIKEAIDTFCCTNDSTLRSAFEKRKQSLKKNFKNKTRAALRLRKVARRNRTTN